jgi:hypothetical protein
MKLDGSTFNTYHISYAVPHEKKCNEKLNYLGTIPVVGTISGGCRIVYGIMKLFLSFVTYPMQNSQAASSRLHESCKQVARGLVEFIPLIGQAATIFIIDSSLIRPSLHEKAVTLIKNNELQKAIEVLSEIPNVAGLDNLPSCIAAKEAMNESFETHPLEATKFAEESKGRFTHFNKVLIDVEGATKLKTTPIDYAKPNYIKLFNRCLADGKQEEARKILKKFPEGKSREECASKL